MCWLERGDALSATLLTHVRMILGRLAQFAILVIALGVTVLMRCAARSTDCWGEQGGMEIKHCRERAFGRM